MILEVLTLVNITYSERYQRDTLYLEVVNRRLTGNTMVKGKGARRQTMVLSCYSLYKSSKAVLNHSM